jgi:hypothetical protein
MRPPPKRMTQSVTFGPDSEFHLASTGGCTRHPRPSPTLCRQFPTWIHLGLRVHTWSPNVIRVWSHPSALCMHGLRRPPRRADFFQRLPVGCDSLLAQQPLQQVHARDQDCRRSAEHPSPARWRWRGRRRWSGWKLAPPTRAIPPRRCHDIGEHIMKSVISHGCDIRSYWYQRAISWIICSDIMWLIIRYWYQSRYSMKCIWYRIWYGMMIAQERQKSIWYCQNGYDIIKKVWYHLWYHMILTISE